MASLPDDDPHNEKLDQDARFTKHPHCIYFYYIGPLNTDHYNTILHYYYPGDGTPLDPESLLAKIRELIANARIRNLRDQLPPPIGENWEFVVWNRISYVVFAVDIPGAVFNQAELVVTQEYGGTYNWSFFDAQRATSIDDCQVVTCINHMKRDSSFNELGAESQYFHFDLLTDPELEWPGKRRYPDSGGTNMGPPIGPP